MWFTAVNQPSTLLNMFPYALYYLSFRDSSATRFGNYMGFSNEEIILPCAITLKAHTLCMQLQWRWEVSSQVKWFSNINHLGTLLYIITYALYHLSFRDSSAITVGNFIYIPCIYMSPHTELLMALNNKMPVSVYKQLNQLAKYVKLIFDMP
jgi:hypothetical protein